jgi:hypothetical protein
MRTMLRWILCKINQPVYSYSEYFMTGKKICAYCRKEHKGE